MTEHRKVGGNFFNSKTIRIFVIQNKIKNKIYVKNQKRKNNV